MKIKALSSQSQRIQICCHRPKFETIKILVLNEGVPPKKNRDQLEFEDLTENVRCGKNPDLNFKRRSNLTET